MRDYAKFVKRGYGRANHLLSIDIRNGQMDRESALALEQAYDGKRPASIDWFLNILQITEDEFYDLLEKHQVHPWKFDRTGVQTGIAPPDMDKWDNTAIDKPVGPPKDETGKTVKYV